MHYFSCCNTLYYARFGIFCNILPFCPNHEEGIYALFSLLFPSVSSPVEQQAMSKFRTLIW